MDEILNSIERLGELAIRYPNDENLGSATRFLLRENVFVKGFPNDYDLGKEIRKVVISK